MSVMFFRQSRSSAPHGYRWRRRSGQGSLQRYRDAVTGPKMALAEGFLAELHIAGDHTEPAAAAVLAELRRAAEHSSQVVPHIHDLWSEQIFRGSYRDDNERTALLGNRFLKPLVDFTDAERAFEETLAAMDLRTLAGMAEEVLVVGGASAEAATPLDEDSQAGVPALAGV